MKYGVETQLAVFEKLSKMEIAFIIATYNRANLLSKILSQIKFLIVPENVSIKVIVINDGCTDQTNEIIRNKFPETIVINGNGNWWWTKSMNEGFKKACELKQNYVLILNDDIEIKPDYLSILLADYSTLPVNTILGSASISINLPHKIRWPEQKNLLNGDLNLFPIILDLNQ